MKIAYIACERNVAYMHFAHTIDFNINFSHNCALNVKAQIYSLEQQGLIHCGGGSTTSCGPGVIGSDVPWLECPACNALTWVITVTE